MKYEAMIEEGPVPEFPFLGVLSGWFGVILIGVTAVTRVLSDNPENLVVHPLLEGMRSLLLALILASLLYLGLRASSSLGTSALPLFINVSTFLIVSFVPFAALWQEASFRRDWPQYQAVARMVEAGTLQPDESGLVQLPDGYRHLSGADGAVRVDTGGGVTRIFFFKRYHTPWNFAGYMYRSDASPPQPGEFNGRWQFTDHKEPHWFYCVSY